MPSRNFMHCSCPHCKVSLHDVLESSPVCPTCKNPLDRHAVYQTRKYPGTFILPHWIGAFGWPLLVILAGVLFALLTWAFLGIIYLKTSAIIISVGLVYFFVKLAGSDK